MSNSAFPVSNLTDYIDSLYGTPVTGSKSYGHPASSKPYGHPAVLKPYGYHEETSKQYGYHVMESLNRIENSWENKKSCQYQEKQIERGEMRLKK